MNRTPRARVTATIATGIAAAVSLAVVAGCGAGEQKFPPSPLHPLVGEPVPVVHQPAIDGGSVDVPVAGAKVTMVDFFASWCGPCAKSLPELDAFASEHEADGVRLVLVSLDEDPNVAGAFLDRLGVKRPAAVDPTLAIAKRFHVEKLPMTFVVNAAGTIVWSGKHHESARDAALTELGKPVPRPTATPPSDSDRPLKMQPSLQ